MRLPASALGQDEHVVLHLRRHPRVLTVPVLGLLVVVAGLVAYGTVHRPTWPALATYAVLLAALAALLWWVVRPVLRWWTSTFTVTNLRVITRHGILSRSGHDVPLNRISNVEYHQSVLDRLLGSGTLVFETVAGDPLVLEDIPHAEWAHVTITEILFGAPPVAGGARPE